MDLITAITIEEMLELRKGWVNSGHSVAFVPTMGALHLGHLSLVEKAKGLADKTVVSIFVNPAQFGPSEDFSKYPRTLDADIQMLSDRKVDAVFLPSTMGMYPEGFSTFVYSKNLAHDLCGRSRPGHFEGVLTIVLKLFNIVTPDYAIFGKKDYQQFKLIEKMAVDLHLPLKIIGGEIVREENGLAMSSRNRYLSETDFDLAKNLFASLKNAKEKHDQGVVSQKALTDEVQETLARHPRIEVEYIELRNASQLTPLESDEIKGPTVLLVAAKIGGTRLIDNIELT